jgi:DNA-binding transcriptional LysR family regulator
MLNITLRQLQIIEAVARHTKVNMAAAELLLTGPAVTLQLKQVETNLGEKLFDRTNKGLFLTEFGQVVLDTARSIRTEILNLEEKMGALRGLGMGTLRLGVVSTGKYFAPMLMAAFCALHPEVKLELFIGNREDTIRRLQNLEVDLLLMGRPPKDIPVRTQLFGDHPFVFISNRTHRLASKLDITKENIATEEFIIREKGSGTRQILEMFLSEIPGRTDNLGAEMDSNETIKQAVIAGLGVAFISGHTIEQELKLKRLVVLDVLGSPIRRQWFSISRKDRNKTPSMEAFEAFLLREGSKYLPLISKTYRS